MQIGTNATTTALTTAAATVVSVAAAEAGANAMAVGVIPTVTGVSAASTVTAQIIRVDTGAVIGNCVAQNTGAGAGQVGPLVVTAPVPPGTAGALALQALVSAGTGTAAGSATAPSTLTILP